MKNKETLVFMGVALVIGILIGVIGSNLAGRKAVVRQPATGMPQGGAPAPAVNNQQNIKILEDLVAKEPGNRKAWVQLGNLNFDSEMPMQAIEAYNKALELDPRDPDVLTDQGIMFQRLGWYDRAIENFQQAHEINPQHLNSLFNLGIVYRDNLNDFPKALAAWEEFLSLNPSGRTADYVRSQIDALRSHPTLPKAQ